MPLTSSSVPCHAYASIIRCTLAEIETKQLEDEIEQRRTALSGAIALEDESKLQSLQLEADKWRATAKEKETEVEELKARVAERDQELADLRDG